MNNQDHLLKSLNKILLEVKKMASTLLESGYYSMQVINVELILDNHGNHVFLWFLYPIEIDSENEIIHRNPIIESQESLLSLIKDLKHCGVEIDRIEDLADEKLQNQLIGKRLKVFYNQKEDGCYRTTFIDGLNERPDAMNGSACG